MSAPVSLQIVVGFLMFAIVFIPLERWLTLRQQGVFRPGWTTDTIHYVVGCLIGKFTDTIGLAVALALLRYTHHGWTTAISAQPIWLQFLELIVVADFLNYVYHRLAHTIPWLWRLHAIHHSSEHMDWLANTRLHPLDKLLGDFFQFIPIFYLGFSGNALIAYALFLGFQGFLNHSNVQMNYGLLRWVVTSPQFHHWHHCNDPKLYDKNFANHLVLLDLLGGTAYLPPTKRMPESYGITESVSNKYFDQVLHPFIPRKPGF